MNKTLVIFIVIAVIIISVWLLIKSKSEHFGGGYRGRRFSRYGRGFRRQFYSNWRPRAYYDWNYYPYWYSDDIRNCIINNVNSCGNTKECYDKAINICT